jgi:hypothetical protein
MIPQLVQRLVTQRGLTREAAAAVVLIADPLDLTLHMDQGVECLQPLVPQCRAGRWGPDRTLCDRGLQRRCPSTGSTGRVQSTSVVRRASNPR